MNKYCVRVERTRNYARRLLAVALFLVVLAGVAVGQTAATSGARPSVSHQAQAQGGHTIVLSARGGAVEYRLQAPRLQSSTFDADVGETVRGNRVIGVIDTGTDTYRFVGPVSGVQLRSNDLDNLIVRIDGREVDPRTLVPPASTTRSPSTRTDHVSTARTSTAQASTAQASTARASTARASTARTSTVRASMAQASTASESVSTGPSAPPPTGTENSSSGGSGIDPLMYVLMGVVCGLFIAGGIAMFNGSK